MNSREANKTEKKPAQQNLNESKETIDQSYETICHVLCHAGFLFCFEITTGPALNAKYASMDPSQDLFLFFFPDKSSQGHHFRTSKDDEGRKIRERKPCTTLPDFVLNKSFVFVPPQKGGAIKGTILLRF